MVESPDSPISDNSSEPPVQTEEGTMPKLSSDFFMQLLNPPACVTRGTCDGCGRCEH